jgi:hypothetical protein
VVLSDPQKGRRLRLGMHKAANGPWRVVDIDSRDLKALVKEFVEDRYGVKIEVNRSQGEQK